MNKYPEDTTTAIVGGDGKPLIVTASSEETRPLISADITIHKDVERSLLWKLDFK